MTEPQDSALVALVVREARLLDEQRFEQWAELFASDGWYWLPVDPRSTDPLLQASHLYDDRLLRAVRLARLSNRDAHSQRPAGRCLHLLQTPEVIGRQHRENRFELRTAFIYTEWRAGHTTSLPGVARHVLRFENEQLRIVLKRVELLHSDQPLPAIEFYI